jgi:two-component system sensor histidine kinase UhpB
VETSLFRIAQEAFTNVARHARADQVLVTVQAAGDTVRLTIADNGIGFIPSHLARPAKGLGWGLLTMRERAEAVGAICRIASNPQHGTEVIVEVPR